MKQVQWIPPRDYPTAGKAEKSAQSFPNVCRKQRFASAVLPLKNKLSVSYRHEDESPAADNTLREPFKPYTCLASSCSVRTTKLPPPVFTRGLVGTQLSAARCHRCLSRGLLQGTPATILIARSCKASGFTGFLSVFFSPTPGFSAYWAEAIFLSSVTPLTAETSEHTGQIKKKT